MVNNLYKINIVNNLYKINIVNIINNIKNQWQKKY